MALRDKLEKVMDVGEDLWKPNRARRTSIRLWEMNEKSRSGGREEEEEVMNVEESVVAESREEQVRGFG